MDDSLVQFLATTELFGHLPEDALRQFAGAATVHHYNPGVTVFEQGSLATHLFVVHSGSVELRRVDNLTGREFMYAIYGPGKSFGEAGVLLDDPYPITAIVAEEAHLVAFGRDVLRQALAHYTSVGIAAARIMARRTNRLLADKGVRFVALSKVPFDPAALQEIPSRLITEHRVVPLARRGRTLTVAMVNPHDLVASDEVRRAARDSYVEVVGVAEPDFDAFLNKHVLPALQGHQGAEAGIVMGLPNRQHAITFIQEGGDQSSEDERRANVSGEQVIKTLNQILGDALVMDTSDVHIEPGLDEIVVRYRIDGQLLRRPETLPMRLHSPLVTRLKAIASMNITERRKPQDGRLSMQFNQREVSLRISTIPTRFGEKVVMRILDRNNALMSLDRIVTVASVRDHVRRLVNAPHGIVLVTGPTGSGKTTTMYSAIMERRDEGVNIVTVEDPIEYTIPGITQVQFNEGTGLDYAAAIRAFLRQDTDIMLIGETRDARTAQNAMQAALSGHLVVTSFHTNSALGTIYRLREMGVEMFLIANALFGVIAQRLVRTICNDCREPAEYPELVLRRIYGDNVEPPPTYVGRGCARCNSTGFRGRTAVLEVLPISEDLRIAIANGAPLQELRRIAYAGGFVSFRDYAKALLSRGLTTPNEIMRVLYMDDDGSGITTAANVRCPACGTVNDVTSRFCEECGEPLDEVKQAVLAN